MTYLADDELCLNFLEDKLSASEFAVLVSRLRHDRNLARTLLSFAADDDWMRELVITQSQFPEASEDEMPVLVVEATTSSRRRFSMATRHLTVGIAVGVAFVLASLSIMHQAIVQEHVAVEESAGEDISSKNSIAVQSVARLVRDVDAKWEGYVRNPVFGRKQRIKTGMKLYPGQELKLTSGLAEFKFFNGAEVILKAPAVFKVQGKKLCGLDLGELIVRAIEERSKGFLVDTPLGDVEDLGTEFGVAISEGGTGKVVVFSGEVDLQTPLPGGDVRHTKLVGDQSATIGVAGGHTQVHVSKGVSNDALAQLHRESQVRRIRGVSIYEVSSELSTGRFQRAARHLVDGSGLKGRWHVDSPDGASRERVDDNRTSGTMWLTIGTHFGSHSSLPEHIVFDLGAHYDLSYIHAWNYNESIYKLTSRGANEVEISASASIKSNDFMQLSTNAGSSLFVFPRASGSPEYRGFKLQFRGTQGAGVLKNVRFVRFDIKSTHGPNPEDPDPGSVGLSEVQFFGVPSEEGSASSTIGDG